MNPSQFLTLSLGALVLLCIVPVNSQDSMDLRNAITSATSNTITGAITTTTITDPNNPYLIAARKQDPSINTVIVEEQEFTTSYQYSVISSDDSSDSTITITDSPVTITQDPVTITQEGPTTTITPRRTTQSVYASISGRWNNQNGQQYNSNRQGNSRNRGQGYIYNSNNYNQYSNNQYGNGQYAYQNGNSQYDNSQYDNSQYDSSALDSSSSYANQGNVASNSVASLIYGDPKIVELGVSPQGQVYQRVCPDDAYVGSDGIVRVAVSIASGLISASDRSLKAGLYSVDGSVVMENYDSFPSTVQFLSLYLGPQTPTNLQYVACISNSQSLKFCSAPFSLHINNAVYNMKTSTSSPFSVSTSEYDATFLINNNLGLPALNVPRTSSNALNHTGFTYFLPSSSRFQDVFSHVNQNQGTVSNYFALTSSFRVTATNIPLFVRKIYYPAPKGTSYSEFLVLPQGEVDYAVLIDLAHGNGKEMTIIGKQKVAVNFALPAGVYAIAVRHNSNKLGSVSNAFYYDGVGGNPVNDPSGLQFETMFMFGNPSTAQSSYQPPAIITQTYTSQLNNGGFSTYYSQTTSQYTNTNTYSQSQQTYSAKNNQYSSATKSIFIPFALFSFMLALLL